MPGGGCCEPPMWRPGVFCRNVGVIPAGSTMAGGGWKSDKWCGCLTGESHRADLTRTDA